MPHKNWEYAGLVVLFALYVSGVWYAISKLAQSGWKWGYCLGAGVLIVVVTAGIVSWLRSMRRL